MVLMLVVVVIAFAVAMVARLSRSFWCGDFLLITGTMCRNILPLCIYLILFILP